MSVRPIVERMWNASPDATLRWLAGAAQRRVGAWRQRRLDRTRPSTAHETGQGALGRYLTLDADDVPAFLAESLGAVAEHILAHRFDLLGSGWTHVHHGAACRGLAGMRYPPGSALAADADGAWLAQILNAPNRAEGRRLWRLVDDPAYRPIDWQLDFKSGYRWSERTWFLDIAVGRPRGADVKVPWELARMQHLPWLATAYLLASEGRLGLRPAQDYRREIRSQILDFLASNPPRFGINWRSPMDATIRIANWLVALDILRGAGAELDPPFLVAVERAALEHGRHIASHLEWSEAARGNHYLANIVGLLFVAAYLPRSAETDAWLAFSIQELAREIEVQFRADGGNFEGSTAYHCLSAELAIYGAALALGLPQEKLAALDAYDHRAIEVRPPFAPAPMPLHDLQGGKQAPLPPRCFAHLASVVAFAHAVTKPDGRIVQVGDNDSGHLFKFHPAWRETDVAEAKRHYPSLAGYHGLADAAPYWDEDTLDRRGLVAAGDALLRSSAESGSWLDATIVRRLTLGRNIGAAPPRPAPLPRGDLTALLAELGRLPERNRRVTEIPVAFGPDPGVTAEAFPDFGLYILRSARLFLALRCAHGSNAPSAPRGHGHDDNLALELQIDGRDVLTDPGSYLYTPVPELRDRYRAASAHAAPRALHAAAAASFAGPFDLVQRAHGVALYCAPDGIAGRLDGPGWTVWRAVELLPDRIRITDAASPHPLAPLPPTPPDISLGYGKLTQDPARSV